MSGRPSPLKSAMKENIEFVGVFELLLHGLVKCVAGLEGGAGIPERAGDDIHLTVAVDVGGVHAVAPVFGSEGDFFERDRARRGRGVGGADGKCAEQREGK